MKKLNILLGLILLFTPYANVFSGANFSIHPSNSEESWFVYNNVQPGAIINDAITIVNPLKYRTTFSVYALDAEIRPDGGFAPMPTENTQRTIGSWLKLKENRVVVEAKSSHNVPFTMRIPSTVTPKKYLGVVLLTTAPKISEGDESSYTGESGLNIAIRVGVRVYVNIAGAPNISDKKIIYTPPPIIENNVIIAKQEQKINTEIKITKNATTSIASSTAELQQEQENAIIQYITLVGQYAIDNQKITFSLIALLLILLLLLYILRREKNK